MIMVHMVTDLYIKMHFLFFRYMIASANLKQIRDLLSCSNKSNKLSTNAIRDGFSNNLTKWENILFQSITINIRLNTFLY